MKIHVRYSKLTSCFKHITKKKYLFDLITTLESGYIIFRNVKVEKEIHFDFAEMFSQINSNK